MKQDLPLKIQNIVGKMNYEMNNVGMSQSQVLIYDDYVLKIQQASEETDNEYVIAQWLKNKAPIPEIYCYHVENGKAFTLMSRMEGKMLCDSEYLWQPELVIGIVAESLKKMWNIDISQCPCQYSRLNQRLNVAQQNIMTGIVDMNNVEPDTFGEQGFCNPQQLLNWLVENQPEEDLVLTHGDYCLPNIFAKENHFTGWIDIGKMGPADRWQDIAIAIRSLEHNFSGDYTDGKKIYDFKPEMLLNALGIEMDERKYHYYLLLDELL